MKHKNTGKSKGKKTNEKKSKSAAKKISEQDLAIGYNSINKNNGLLKLLKDLREGKRVRHTELRTMFENMPDWEQAPGATGHLSFSNKITGIKVCFQAHNGGKKSDSTAKKAIMDQLLNQIQTHVNIIGNDIIGYTSHNFKKEPENYKSTLSRFHMWQNQKETGNETKEIEAASSYQSKPIN